MLIQTCTKFSFIEAGKGTITINGQPYVLTSGTCIVVAPHESHEVSNTGTTELVLTYFGIQDLTAKTKEPSSRTQA